MRILWGRKVYFVLSGFSFFRSSDSVGWLVLGWVGVFLFCLG